MGFISKTVFLLKGVFPVQHIGLDIMNVNKVHDLQ